MVRSVSLLGSNIRLMAPDIHAADRKTLNSNPSLDISVTNSVSLFKSILGRSSATHSVWVKLISFECPFAN